MNAAAYFLSEVNEGGLTTFSGMDYIKKLGHWVLPVLSGGMFG